MENVLTLVKTTALVGKDCSLYKLHLVGGGNIRFKDVSHIKPKVNVCEVLGAVTFRGSVVEKAHREKLIAQFQNMDKTGNKSVIKMLMIYKCISR
jgi:hypothetical protein